jgi:MFS family permease
MLTKSRRIEPSSSKRSLASPTPSTPLTTLAGYGSAFLLTNCSTLLLFGKLYTIFSPKLVFLSSISIFTVSSTAFIIGRAIAVTGGVIVIIAHTIPLYRRLTFQGIFGAVFGISFVVGPLFRGALTNKVQQRM